MTARMRDVARAAGVSVKTVSNVINDYPHVTPATRAKVQAAIADLDYRPNLGARSLRKGRCGVIALVIPDLTPQYFATLAGAIARAAKKSCVAVLIEQTDGDPTAESLALTGLRDRLVDGILLWPTSPAGASSSASASLSSSAGASLSSPGGAALSPSGGARPSPSRALVLLGEGRPDLLFDRVSSECSLVSVGDDHQALADRAVGLLLDRIAGVGSVERRHVIVQSDRPRAALRSG